MSDTVPAGTLDLIGHIAKAADIPGHHLRGTWADGPP